MDAIGRLVDFGDLKRMLKGWIDDHWDHAFLLWEDDENAIAAIKSVRPTKYYLLPANPTAENIARHLLEDICPRLLTPLRAQAVCVAVWETEDSCAQAALPIEESLFRNSALLAGEVSDESARAALPRWIPLGDPLIFPTQGAPSVAANLGGFPGTRPCGACDAASGRGD